MTIIAAVQSEDGTWVGSDTMLSGGDRKIAANCNKWIIYRNWGMGFAGIWRVHNILQAYQVQLLSNLKYPEDFVKRVIKLFNEHEVSHAGEPDNVKNFGQNIILAKKNGPVWHIDTSLSISEMPFDTLWSEGSGSDYGLGASFALKDRPAEERIRAAVEAASEYCTTCGGEPFVRKL